MVQHGSRQLVQSRDFSRGLHRSLSVPAVAVSPLRECSRSHRKFKCLFDGRDGPNGLSTDVVCLEVCVMDFVLIV